MAEDLAELGLDNKSFVKGVDESAKKIDELGNKVGGFTGLAITALTSMVALVVKARIDAAGLRKELEQFEKLNPFGDALTPIKEFEANIKSLQKTIKEMDNEGVLDRIGRFVGSSHIFGGSGFDKSEEEREDLRIRAAKVIEESIVEIGKREEKNAEILRLQLDGEEEKAKVLKIQLEYRDKIGKAIAEGLPGVAAALKTEEKITLELERQNEERKRGEWDKRGNADQLRVAAEEVERNKKEAEQNQKDAEKRGEFDRMGQREMLNKAAEEVDRNRTREQINDKDTQDFLDDIAGQKADYDASNKSRLQQMKERARQNNIAAMDANIQTRQGAAVERGQSRFAQELATRQSYAQRRREANERGATDAEIADINAQEQQALRFNRAEEGQQTPSQARAERHAQDRITQDANKQEAREQELRDRAGRGQTSRAIKDQLKRDADRAAVADNEKKAADQLGKSQPWSGNDSANLKKCADQLANKD